MDSYATQETQQQHPLDDGPAQATREQLELRQATRDQLRQITHSIASLEQPHLSWSAYFTQFLQLTTTALHSLAGAVWRLDQDGTPNVLTELGGTNVGSQAERGEAIRTVVAVGQPMVLAPQTTSSQWGAANTSDHLLLLLPLRLEGQVVALVEIYQRADRGPAVQRGYMAYLIQVGELAERYLQQWQLSELRAQHDWSQQLERFLGSIHHHLGVDETAYCLVNEARQLVSADRVSLVLGTGRQCRVKVVSGLDSVDRRAAEVRHLARLASCVIRTGEAVWLDTHQSDRSDSNLPPQIETVWHRYVDSSHARRCAIVPLQAGPGVEGTKDVATPFGALVFEQLTDAREHSLPQQRVHQVCRHAASALCNARQHESLFLMPLWRFLGNLLDALGGRHFGKTLAATVLCVSAMVALTTTKTAFTIPVRGTLQPELRRTIFAGEAGVITDIHVEHGQQVQAGQLLVEMRNTDLDVEITSLLGQQTTTREQVFALQRSLLSDRNLDPAQQNQLNGELLQQQQMAESIERQLRLLRQKQQQLSIRADRAGQVVTWHVRDRLWQRPVQQGQALLALIDPRSPWELELYVPARHSGYVLDAWSEGQQEVPVTFSLSSHPGETFRGTIQVVDHVAVDRDELGSAVRVRVAIQATALPELKADATVVAKIHCGQTSLGYAWFHDLIDTVQAQWMFWF